MAARSDFYNTLASRDRPSSPGELATTGSISDSSAVLASLTAMQKDKVLDKNHLSGLGDNGTNLANILTALENKDSKSLARLDTPHLMDMLKGVGVSKGDLDKYLGGSQQSLASNPNAQAIFKQQQQQELKDVSKQALASSMGSSLAMAGMAAPQREQVEDRLSGNVFAALSKLTPAQLRDPQRAKLIASQLGPDKSEGLAGQGLEDVITNSVAGLDKTVQHNEGSSLADFLKQGQEQPEPPAQKRVTTEHIQQSPGFMDWLGNIGSNLGDGAASPQKAADEHTKPTEQQASNNITINGTLMLRPDGSATLAASNSTLGDIATL